jgi:hypothetical protein
MKTLKQLFATLILAMALVTSVHAGDMNCPPADPPPPGMKSSDIDGHEVQNPTAPDADIDITTIVRDVIWDLLSMY